MNKALVVARKPGKLPRPGHTAEYKLEYGENSFTILSSEILKSVFKAFLPLNIILQIYYTINTPKFEMFFSKNLQFPGLYNIIMLYSYKLEANIR